MTIDMMQTLKRYSTYIYIQW